MIKCESFVVADWTDQGKHPGMPIAPLHLHRSDDEAWYVLSGQLGFRLGEREVVVGAGSGAFVPRGVAHTFWNPSPEPARYLLIMTPRIKELVDELHVAEDRSPAAMDALWAKYDSEMLGWN
jgi:mannose-6-phosphate isomerase-like protein (cupin superfamily)